MGFKRPPHDRNISFEEISTTTKVPFDEVTYAVFVLTSESLFSAWLQVEHLLMRGLSLKLIRGDIDEKARIFYMTWVKPRILSMDQVRDFRVFNK